METKFTEGLATPIRFLKGVGEVRAEQLARLNIFTVGDLLLTLPHRYEDRQKNVPMNHLPSGEFVSLTGSVVTCGWIRPRFGKSFFEAVLTDQTGFVRCRWFGAAYLQDQLKPGEQLLVWGKIRRQRGEAILQQPEIEWLKDEQEQSMHTGRIVPIYPLTDNLPQRTMRRIVWNAVEIFAAHAEEILPPETVQRWNLMDIKKALVVAHFPTNLEEATQARFRLVFEEFLCMQLVLVARKKYAEQFLKGTSFKASGALRQSFLATLPFTLTAAQKRASEEIRVDMEKPHPMHRLLQGDVGSGKTVVAACALLDVIECGAQAAIMAPTEILALQHKKTFAKYFSPLGIKIVVLTSNMTDNEKIAARAQIADGRCHLVVGTHALIQERVVFKKLGLVVIDEQHKFGVEQRGLLYEKGEHPDVLVMTATPIPRTLAMTIYGDLDVTVIDEMPGGRHPIVTRVISETHLEKAYGFIREQVGKGRQAYIVYPLVSESDVLELKSAEEMFVQLKTGPFNGLQVGLLHGQMNTDAKEKVMQQFVEGKIQILIATTVIEVGIDVPNANIMLVENAERFGLAQLHQLRGRIGRGPHKSFCVLQGAPAGKEAWKRLKIMEETANGFRIAEEDFKIRGMGNLFGRQQSGMPTLRVGDLIADVKILDAARHEATTLVDSDVKFENPAYEKLRQRARALYKLVGPFMKIG